MTTTKRWMKALSPVARGVFSWDHDVLVRDVARGFAESLGVPLVSVDNRSVAPGSPDFGRSETTP